jgi:predicted acetyltransferase
VSGIEIVHPVPVDEVRPLAATLATTFLEEASGERFEAHVEAWDREWRALRAWGARDPAGGGRWVATLATEPQRLTIPAGATGTRDIAADGLTAVTVNATHRRRGLLTRMITESLDEAKQRGDAVSILIAAEWAIYGRFGYAPASRAANYTFFPRSRADLLRPAETGTVRQVDAADLAAIAPEIFERSRHCRAGQTARDGEWWPRRLGVDGYRPVHYGKAPTYYLHEGTDGPDGLLWWSPTKDFELTGEQGAISVGDLTAATGTAYRNLWAYLASIDLVGEIALLRRPVDEPVRWLCSDGRALRQTYAGDDLWLRLLDVPAALSARGYAREDRVVLDVSDDGTGGYGQGRFVLDSGTGECRPTTETAELELTQRALASIYLGGFTLREQRIAGGVHEVRPGALDRVDGMFATIAPPWNATSF